MQSHTFKLIAMIAIGVMTIACYPYHALSADLPTLDIPTIPVTGKYQEAASKAQEATLIQTGVTGQISAIKTFANAQAMTLVKKTGVERELAATLFVYKVYHDRSVSIPVAKDKRLTISDKPAILFKVDF